MEECINCLGDNSFTFHCTLVSDEILLSRLLHLLYVVLISSTVTPHYIQSLFPHFIYLFIFCLSSVFVQLLQFRYQSGVLYRLRALGISKDMDITKGWKNCFCMPSNAKCRLQVSTSIIINFISCACLACVGAAPTVSEITVCIL